MVHYQWTTLNYKKRYLNCVERQQANYQIYLKHLKKHTHSETGVKSTLPAAQIHTCLYWHGDNAYYVVW